MTKLASPGELGHVRPSDRRGRGRLAALLPQRGTRESDLPRRPTAAGCCSKTWRDECYYAAIGKIPSTGSTSRTTVFKCHSLDGQLTVINELNLPRLSDRTDNFHPGPQTAAGKTDSSTDGRGFGFAFDAHAGHQCAQRRSRSLRRSPPGCWPFSGSHRNLNSDGVTFRATITAVHDALTSIASLQAQLDSGPFSSWTTIRGWEFSRSTEFLPGALPRWRHYVHLQRGFSGKCVSCDRCFFSLLIRRTLFRGSGPVADVRSGRAAGRHHERGTRDARRKHRPAHHGHPQRDDSFGPVDCRGPFQLPGAALRTGDTLLSLQTTDVAGSASEFSTTLRRVDSPGRPDPCCLNTSSLIEAIQQDATTRPVATRMLAMMHAAMYDVVAMSKDSELFRGPAAAGRRITKAAVFRRQPSACSRISIPVGDASAQRPWPTPWRT